MDILNLTERDGVISIPLLLANSNLPFGDRRRLSAQKRDRLAKLAIEQMRSVFGATDIDPSWIL